MSGFQEIYLQYNQDVYQFLLKMTNYDSHLSEELTQETFFQVYLSLPRYKGKSSMLTWICAIAKNICYKYYRKNPINFELGELDTIAMKLKNQIPTPLEIIEHKELSNYLNQEIMALKTKYRNVLIYRLFYGFAFKEIAIIMKINENSAKVLYHRGKEVIKKRLEEYKNE